MTYSDPYTSSIYDQDLAAVAGLTWVPWVGRNFAKQPDGKKVLIVAESHYSNEQNAEKAPLSIQAATGDKTYTRAVVSESLIDNDWSTRTLSTMHQLFYSPKDRDAFWSEVAFYNVIQRPMWYRDGNPERPTWEDFWKGWEAFLSVEELLKPDHVLFIGVDAANHFNGFMSHHSRDHVSVEWAEKVGSAYARTAKLVVDGRHVPLHFIKHCGSYFSTERWVDYLHRHAPDLMASLAASARVTAPAVPPRRLHVFGMAKSSLDLRGAKAPKLELDFLRLLYAVREIREAEEEAVGYLTVLNEAVAQTASKWIDKYGAGESVKICCAGINEDQLRTLRDEKRNNAIGLLKDRNVEGAEIQLSAADLGKTCGEEALAAEIKKLHPGIEPLHATVPADKLPLHVAWDFYGTLAI